MFTGLPQLADKNFVVGFFLPALLALIGCAWAFPDVTALKPLRDLGLSDQLFSSLTYVVLTIIVLAILLLTANYFLYRLFEGYLPPVSWCRPLKLWHESRFTKLQSGCDRLTEEWKTALENSQIFPAAKSRELTQLTQRRLTFYPPNVDEILPTRFGNTIKAFETYPREVYGADGISLWLRLASVMPKDFSGLLDDARTFVDCFVNITFLGLIIGVVALTKVIADTVYRGGSLEVDAKHYVLVAAIGFSIAVMSYRWATGRVVAWGDLVKSAFDCYLPALATQLGYQLPESAVDRKQFWSELSILVLYQKPMTVNRWKFLLPGSK